MRTPQVNTEQPTTPNPTKDEHIQIGLRGDESKLQTSYANALCTDQTAEEIAFDLGDTPPHPPPADGDRLGEPRHLANVTLYATHRVVMNYYTAKHPALSLAEIVRRHDQAFGELELDTRRRPKK